MSITISSEVLGTLSVTVAETTGVLSVSVLATAPAVLSMELGTPGPSPTITVGTTTTLAPGSPATVTDVGTALAAVFDFGIPQGTQGTQGIQGIQGIQGTTGATGATGATGTAATIAAGTTTTLSPGSSATVTNAGTSSAAVFNFGIPQGTTGATGAGVPVGGSTAQLLSKASGTNYDTTWTTVIPGDRYLTTSTTSNSVSNGNKTFTIGTGLSYTPTQNITISFDASNHMHGEVLTYNSGTGVLTVDINHKTGSGTYTSWVVNVGGVTPATSVDFSDITGAVSGNTNLQAALDLKSNLASPTFTGTPTLPTGTIGTTQTALDSTTALATTAFVTTADALKAPLASPVFTGDPQAPTPSTGDNDTSIATTAFVKAQAYLTDAPSDSKAYVRQNAAWLALVSDIPDFAWYDHPPVNWNTNVANGATSAIASGNCVNLVTSAGTANSRASVYTWKSTAFALYVSQFNGNAANAQYRLNWSRKLAIFTAFNQGSVGLANANVDYYFVMGQPVAGFAGTFTDKGMGVHINTTAANVTRIRIIYHDGTTQKASSYVSFGTAVSGNNLTNASVTLFSDGAGTIKLFAYSNVLQGLAITVTDGPTGVGSTDHNVNVGASLITGATASQNSLMMFMPRVYFGL
jgi:hypothetical protein